MTTTEWILFFFALQGVHFLGTWKLYKAAGFQAWQAAVPIYNAFYFNENHQASRLGGSFYYLSQPST